MKSIAHITPHSFRMLFVFIIAFLLLNISAGSATEVKSNYEILDSLAGQTAGILCDALAEYGDNKYIIKLPDLSAAPLIEKNVVIICRPKKILFLSNSDSSEVPVVEILINKFGIKYSNHPEVDFLLEREAFCEIEYLIRDDNEEIIPGNPISLIFRDTIGRSSIRLIENSGYDFAKATVPEPEDSFLKQIAEPLIIISSAAIAVFLFFTVRSG